MGTWRLLVFPKLRSNIWASLISFASNVRDDDMAPRLSLPAKQLRRTLQFLEEQQLVKHELVDDLSSGGSQNTKVSSLIKSRDCDGSSMILNSQNEVLVH